MSSCCNLRITCLKACCPLVISNQGYRYESMENQTITLKIGLHELLCQNQWFITNIGIINVDFRFKILDLKLMVISIDYSKN